MASPSSDPMDDGSFRARVHKVFSSLSTPPSSNSPALQPLWSLTDDEVEKRDWKRSKSKPGKDDDSTLCSSSFDGMFKRNRDGLPKGCVDADDLSGEEDGEGEKNGFVDRDDLSGEEDGEGEKQGFDEDIEVLSGEDDGEDADVLEIRSSIGLDSTLDNEEEEDEYDRIAEGEWNTSHSFSKDPRADQIAAELRLREDDVEASKRKPKVSDDHFKPKPILKMKENSEAKSGKRVRFDPSFVDDLDNDQQERSPVSADESQPKVPDHLINLSKYTRYSLDSCGEIDDVSNSRACMYVLEEVKKWKQKSSPTEIDSHQPVSFVPKKKTSSIIAMEDDGKDYSKESVNPPSFPVHIAAWEEQKNGSETTEEDDDFGMDMTEDGVVRKPDRRYRSKSSMEDDLD
ncbi:unnamed protein product [Cuscuta epithymum]|uniref:Protein TSSC4 n=1 Tax=Cuscuta epithymum TaxID=186058 RepID=A0AAV0C154_9ASTE|nr:unnamed protein product [Cuscuta epithymum]CAH9129693.1 unnamed protein product [Cuscuta epithymum]